MLFLENLNARDGAWEGFENRLIDSHFSIIVYKGLTQLKQHDRQLTVQEVEYLKKSFRNAELPLMGMSSKSIIGPMFSINAGSNNHAYISDYLTYNIDENNYETTISNDFSSLAVYLSHFHKNIKHVIFDRINCAFQNEFCTLRVQENKSVLSILS